MYTLRIIIEERENKNFPFEQTIHNYSLGNSYTKVENGTKNFERIMTELYPEVQLKDEVKAIICSEVKKEWFIMKNKENQTFCYFIMTENGSTFERLN